MKAKILVIDDDRVILTELQKLFEKNGFESKIASGSEEIVDLVSHEHFDIVYTDMKMYLMDGVAVCRLVKKLSPDTAVVIFSGSPYTMAERQFEFLENGGIDLFLRKPLTKGEILKATEDILKQKHKGDAAFN